MSRAAQPYREATVTIVASEVMPTGGQERVLTKLVAGLLRRGHAVRVVARRCEVPERGDLRWTRIRAPKRPFALAYPWFALAASLALRRVREGVLHSTGAIVLNRVDLSTVHYCHRAFYSQEAAPRRSRDSPAYRFNALIAKPLRLLGERWCYRRGRTRRLVPVSRGVAAELRHQFPAMAHAVTVIPNGVDPRDFRSSPSLRSSARAELGIGDGSLMALFVGGDWERKGLRFAIEGVARTPDWRLMVVGDGDIRAFRQLAAEAGAFDRVTFVGRAGDPARFYAAADAFVFPTAYEAFPLVALEAAASGLPLLAGRASGIEDILVPDENGWFVERDGAEIAARLVQLGRDADLRQQMGRAAADASRDYTWDVVVERYLELYRELAGNLPE